MAALLADGTRHRNHHLVAANCADHRQGDAGVSRRDFHDRHAGSQLAASLCGKNDVLRNAVLDTAARIHVLGLAINVAAGSVAGRVDANERSIADRIENAGGNQAGRRLPGTANPLINAFLCDAGHSKYSPERNSQALYYSESRNTYIRTIRETGGGWNAQFR